MNTSPLLDFRKQREQDWVELAKLLDRIEKHRGEIVSTEEALRLGELYRRTATHLSVIRTNPREKRLEGKVQQLLVRAHGIVYRPKKTNPGRTFAEFFLKGFPRAVRNYRQEVGLSALLFLVGGVLGWGATTIDPDLYYSMVPIEEARSPAAAVESLEATLTSGREGGFGQKSAFSGFLWQHNVRVGLLCFALGALAGVPTFLLTLFNGLMLGAMSAVFLKAGLGADWFAWLAGHGVTEILALILASAGGFALGRAVLRPGPLTRRDALAEAGKKAVGMVMGTVIMLFIAALLESFFRQSEASRFTRYFVAYSSGAWWLFYFLVVGREPKADLNPSETDNY